LKEAHLALRDRAFSKRYAKGTRTSLSEGRSVFPHHLFVLIEGICVSLTVSCSYSFSFQEIRPTSWAKAEESRGN